MGEQNKPITDARVSDVGDREDSGFNPSGTGAESGQSSDGSASSSSSTTVRTGVSVPVSTTVPDEFRGSSNQALIDYLERKIKEHRPLSDADLAKIRRRQKAEGVISGISDAVMSVANLVATHHYAPNMYNPKEGMSAKAKERFDREKAEREAEDDRYFNYAITLGRLRDADKARGLQAWQIEQNLARQDRAYNAGRQDRLEDKALDEQVRREQGERWQKQFDEGVRQFDVSSANYRKRLYLEGQRLAKSMSEGRMTFNLGSGHGNVTLSLDRLNAQTVSRIYSTLPEAALYNPKKDVYGNAVMDSEGNIQYDRNNPKLKGEPIVRNGFVVGYKEPTTEAMLIAIGANVESSPATQSAIKQVAGLETGKKPAGY